VEAVGIGATRREFLTPTLEIVSLRDGVRITGVSDPRGGGGE